MIRPDARISKNAQVVSRALGEGEGGVLLHLESGQYHGLNGAGWMAWQVIDGHKGLVDIVTSLRQSFDDAPAHLEADITEFLEGLLARDLIALSGD